MLTAVVVATTSCGPVDGPSLADDRNGESRKPSGVISGEDALGLYGITPDARPQATPTVLDQFWFPLDVWVSASVLPYGDQAPIRILPVFSDPGLDVSGTWLGDLPEGERLELKGVDQTGRSCFIVGASVQGWEVNGWVACNRLLFHKPTTVPGS